MLALDVQLLDGRYDAATTDKEVAEWPPHPARAFCALVAGARDDRDWVALEWLEKQPAPEVVAAGSATRLRQSGYVVTNRREPTGGSQFHPGRSNQLRIRVGAQPASDRIRFEWRDAVASDDVFATLDRLALRVPYLGRSTGHVIAAFDQAERDSAGLARHRPCSLTAAEAVLRVPFGGYVDALRAAYEEGRASAELARSHGYRTSDDVFVPSHATSGPFRDLVILRLPGIRPDGRLATRLTTALRAAILSLVAEPLPAVLHGHGADGKPHVAFVALPDTLHPRHSRGDILGLAVALPDLPRDERRRIVQALVAPDSADHSWVLRVPGLGAVVVQYDAQSPAPEGLVAERWTRASRTWVTATPMALDRYPKKDDDWIDGIGRSCVVAGYPRPTDVEISLTPLVSGAVRLVKSDLPERLAPKVLRHIRLRFAEPVRGPVLIGAGRYLGVGLFQPERER